MSIGFDDKSALLGPHEPIKDIPSRLQADFTLLTNMGYEVLGVFVQGSQNYNLQYEDSDIDTKAIVLPSFHDLIHGVKPTSTTHVLPSNEHIDIKDIREMFNCWKRQNIQFLEVLFAKEFYINPEYKDIYDQLHAKRHVITQANHKALMNCIVGVQKQKQNALCHPYPAVADRIEKYGYDPKQLHHILRLEDFQRRLLAGETFGQAMWITNPLDREYLITAKRIPPLYTKDEAIKLADQTVKACDAINKEFQASCTEPEVDISELLNSTIEMALQHYYSQTWNKDNNISHPSSDKDAGTAIRPENIALLLRQLREDTVPAACFDAKNESYEIANALWRTPSNVRAKINTQDAETIKSLQMAYAFNGFRLSPTINDSLEDRVLRHGICLIVNDAHLIAICKLSEFEKMFNAALDTQPLHYGLQTRIKNALVDSMNKFSELINIPEFQHVVDFTQQRAADIVLVASDQCALAESYSSYIQNKVPTQNQELVIQEVNKYLGLITRAGEYDAHEAIQEAWRCAARELIDVVPQYIDGEPVEYPGL